MIRCYPAKCIICAPLQPKVYDLNCEWHPRLYDVDGFELALQFATDGCGGNHRSVVCTEAAIWDTEADSLLVAVVLQARSEPTVGAYTEIGRAHV